MFLGNSAANGKIYELSDAQFSDDGAAIDSYYTTAYFVPSEVEDSLQLRSHRKLFGYFTAFVEGSGSLSLSAFADNSSVVEALPTVALSTSGAARFGNADKYFR